MLTDAEFDKITEKVFQFHTKKAPGLPIAVAMVDLARELLGPVKGKLNVIAETQACLSDVIQVMTGCTMGNRYMKVMKDLGRYALTMYDREDGRGVRVFVDLKKIDPKKTPELYRFFRRERGEAVEKGGEAREASGMTIVQEFKMIGRDIFGTQRVKVLDYAKPPMLHAIVCPGCGESFLSRNVQHVKCDVCSGQSRYFEPQP